MKKIIYLPLILFIISCTTKPVEKVDNRIEITPFVIDRVILQDSNLLSNVHKKLFDADSAKIPMYKMEEYMSNRGMFMNSSQYNQLTIALKYLINNPKSKVYAYPGGPALNPDGIKNIMWRCDSIIESSFDSKGKETIKKSFMCDSTSVFWEINMIDYYEAIYFNKETNMIDKEILGYGIKMYNERLKMYRGLIYIFRDQKAIDTAMKYGFY